MARRVEGPLPGVRIRGKEQYPWNEWFDGSVWELSSPEDFRVKLKDFTAMAYQAARRRGMRAHIHIADDDGRLFMQATRKAAE